MIRLILVIILGVSLIACSSKQEQIDFLLLNGEVIDGTGGNSFRAAIGIKDGIIVFIGESDESKLKATQIIDATGLIISPGFIDPHTHSLGDLKSRDRKSNLNYLYQGVTTVMNGNDGEGPVYIDSLSDKLMAHGIGTNTAFLVGHGTIRKLVLGERDVAPDSLQLLQMKNLVKIGMEQGAFGFSTGLYYAPGSYATTGEIIELAKVVKSFGGLYESHIRDESTYNIGLINAIKEAIEIGEKAGIPVHIAHIKALGIDVWNKSNEVIEVIEKAQERGIRVTADQYPWKASGTHIENALFDRWVMAGGDKTFLDRLNNETLLPRIHKELTENLRKRGGADAILITADCYDSTMIGKTLGQISKDFGQNPVNMALEISKNGGARIASFNMQEDDIVNFMKQSWVMTCSDGTKGHPRKFASYPQKFKEYILDKKTLTIEDFVHRSSGLVAKSFGISKRGNIKIGYKADIIAFDSKKYRPIANFYQPSELTKGMQYVFINGKLVIEKGKYTGKNEGFVLRNNANYIKN